MEDKMDIQDEASFRRDMEMVFKKVDVAQDLQRKGRFGEAARLLLPEIESMDNMFKQGFLKETDDYRYFYFNSMYEHMLYWFYEHPKKEIRFAPYDYGRLYSSFGSILIDLHEFKGARIALMEAMKWNPMRADYALEYAETFKMTGEIDKFFELTKSIFKFAYLPKHVARCYRSLGYYFVEKELWNEATECFTISLYFDESEYASGVVRKETDFIYHKTGEKPSPSWNNMEKYSKQYGFPYGPDKDVFNFARYQGEKMLKDKKYDEAKYLLNICYSLLPKDDIKALLNQIEAHYLEQNKGKIRN